MKKSEAIKELRKEMEVYKTMEKELEKASDLASKKLTEYYKGRKEIAEYALNLMAIIAEIDD